MSKLRFAQAGVSLMHATMCRDILMLLSDEIEHVGFYDPAPDAVRERIKPDAAHVPFYPDLSTLCAAARPDAVMVLIYPVDMPTWMLQNAEAGVHIWGEKPIATCADQLVPVAAAVAGRGLQFSTGYSWRFNPIARQIRDALKQGLLGQPHAFAVNFSISSVKRRDPTSWAFQSALCGGAILNWLGCRWFDLMRFITGSERASFTAIEANVGGEDINVEIRQPFRCVLPIV